MGARVIVATVRCSEARTVGVLGERLIRAHTLIPLKPHGGEISGLVGLYRD